MRLKNYQKIQKKIPFSKKKAEQTLMLPGEIIGEEVVSERMQPLYMYSYPSSMLVGHGTIVRTGKLERRFLLWTSLILCLSQ